MMDLVGKELEYHLLTITGTANYSYEEIQLAVTEGLDGVIARVMSRDEDGSAVVLFKDYDDIFEEPPENWAEDALDVAGIVGLRISNVSRVKAIASLSFEILP